MFGEFGEFTGKKWKIIFIDVKTINEKKYYHTFKKSYSTNLETESLGTR
jgi:hypothetical protein